jgi:hypothetical protein
MIGDIYKEVVVIMFTRIGLCFGVVIQIVCSIAFSAEQSLQTKTLLAAMDAAISQIQSIEVPYKLYAKEPDMENEKIFFDFQWGYQEQNNKEYHFGRTYMKSHDFYSSVAYNGDLLTSFDFKSESGAIRFDNIYFLQHPSPNRLWGKIFDSFPNENLMDTFLDAEITDDADSPDHVKKLSKVVYVPPLEEGKIGIRTRYSVWIDMQRGFMPVRFHEFDILESSTSREVVITEMVEPMPGIWIPIKGTITAQFTKEPIIPDGLTEEEWGEKNLTGLSEDEMFEKITREIKWPTEEIVHTIILDTEKLVLNQPIADDKFTYKFKDGDRIWNSLKQSGDIVGKEEHVIDKSADVVVPKTSGNLWRVVVGLAGLSIVVITLFLAYRGRQN